MNDHETATAKAAHPRFRNRQGKGGRNGRINRITAGVQNICPDLGSFDILRRNDAAGTVNDRFRNLPCFKRCTQCGVLPLAGFGAGSTIGSGIRRRQAAVTMLN